MASLPEFAAAVIAASILAGDFSAAGRELRPSDHGLVFQATSPTNSSPESMRSFFNSDASSSSSSSSSASSSDASPFPEASNFTGSLPPEIWRAASSGGGRRFGGALVVASLVCGVTGFALLVATGLIYLFKHRRKDHELNDASFRVDDVGFAVSNRNDNEATNRSANKLQLVAVPVVRNS